MPPTAATGSEDGISGYFQNISEFEIDDSWRLSQSPEYRNYREQFSLAENRKYEGTFPINLEIEATYYCNLKCPFCPRALNIGERDSEHMSEETWQKILDECRENGLSSLQMDHEAESLMNPRIFEMIKQAKEAGVIDIWLHTNANLLTRENSIRLIDSGLTKINFSVDAATEETYRLLRIGGKFHKVQQNIKNFLAVKEDKEASYLRTRVSFVVQKENFHEREAFYDFWKNEKGLNLITFQNHIDFSDFEKPDVDIELSNESLEIKYASREPFYCSLPWTQPVIEENGSILPCEQPVRNHNQNFVLGNLNQGDSLKSCWNGNKLKALRQLHMRGEWYKEPMCRVCVNAVRISNHQSRALDRAGQK